MHTRRSIRLLSQKAAHVPSSSLALLLATYLSSERPRNATPSSRRACANTTTVLSCCLLLPGARAADLTRCLAQRITPPSRPYTHRPAPCVHTRSAAGPAVGRLANQQRRATRLGQPSAAARMRGKKRERKPRHRQSLHEQIEDPQTYGVRVSAPGQLGWALRPHLRPAPGAASRGGADRCAHAHNAHCSSRYN